MTYKSFPATKFVRRWVMPYRKLVRNKLIRVRGYYRKTKIKVYVKFKLKQIQNNESRVTKLKGMQRFSTYE